MISRGTTPTFTLTLPETVDLSEAQNVYATFRSVHATVTKTGADLDVTEHTVDIYMDQEETLKFGVGTVEVQLNWTYPGGQRMASTIEQIKLSSNLLERVVE